ncbi:MAG: phosphatase PAP2 family protein [Actinomycetota bacterium]|nr:phosphatase PAP2 family protein [Actinomycetota bacterium]
MTSTEDADLIAFPAPGDAPDSPTEGTDYPLGPAVAALDAAVDRAWESLRGHPVADRIFYSASQLGDFSLLWHLLGATRGLAGGEGVQGAVRLSAALATESALVNGAVKSLFRRERPAEENGRPYRLRQPLTSSFPSGHASAAFLAATLLAERSKVKPLWYSLAGVVAASRVHVRIHHASDVVVGAALGLMLGRIARRVLPLR